MNGRKGFFEEKDGKLSMMRLLSFMIVCSGIIFAGYELIMYSFVERYIVHTELLLTWMTIGVTGKGAQYLFDRFKNKDKNKVEDEEVGN